MRAALLVLVVFSLPVLAAERQLLDEVVAVVEAHSITLSEVTAETRVRLAESQGPAAASAPLDRRILGASLRKTIEERVVLSEMQRLKLFDLESARGGGRWWRACARSFLPAPTTTRSRARSS